MVIPSWYLTKLNRRTLINKIQKRRLAWFDHVKGVEDNRLTHKALHCYIEGVRSRGRQRKTWIDNVKEVLEKKNAAIEAAMELTDGSEDVSCSRIVSSADGREQRRRRRPTGPGLLSLAIPSWVGGMSTGDGLGHGYC